MASASIITVYQQGMLTLHNNIADKGGGVYLESNARLYLSKSVPELSIFNSTIHTIVQFTGNHAIYGGAMYVADNTNSGDCKPAQECPLQTLVTDSTYGENRNFLNMIFSEDNSATVAGSNLYGGLLDRCIPNPFAEVHQQWFEQILSLYYNGVTYLRNISNITVESISSPPVKVCFCISKGRPDCNYHLPTVQVKKGEAFTVLIHPNCPFDYCYSLTKEVSINLNVANGADAQCQFNRSGILCGSCQQGFSLSLGSSRCLQCHRYRPLVFAVILLASLLAGIVLVTMLLVLNMTVADGLINGLSFMPTQ